MQPLLLCFIAYPHYDHWVLNHQTSLIDDSIPNDRKRGYAMKLRITVAFPEGLYFEIFTYALPYHGIEHFLFKI